MVVVVMLTERTFKKETGWESVEWFNLFQDSNQWWTFINMMSP
jgi:hypothetical protein